MRYFLLLLISFLFSVWSGQAGDRTFVSEDILFSWGGAETFVKMLADGHPIQAPDDVGNPIGSGVWSPSEAILEVKRIPPVLASRIDSFLSGRAEVSPGKITRYDFRHVVKRNIDLGPSRVTKVIWPGKVSSFELPSLMMHLMPSGFQTTATGPAQTIFQSSGLQATAEIDLTLEGLGTIPLTMMTPITVTAAPASLDPKAMPGISDFTVSMALTHQDTWNAWYVVAQQNPSPKQGILTYNTRSSKADDLQLELTNVVLRELTQELDQKTKMYQLIARLSCQRIRIKNLVGLQGISTATLRPGVATVEKPSWASDSGTDSAGTWADVQIGGVVQRLRWCPPGTFRMGSGDKEPERIGSETQHQVTLSKGFWIADSEVSQVQWQTIMGNTPSHHSGDPVRPVENISWNDAKEFLGRLNQKFGGLDADLPTEAQWEYACRAGSTNAFRDAECSLPDDLDPALDRLGWFEKNAQSLPQAVKRKTANAWGIFDMHGNVSEWCQDWYLDFTASDQIDPKGPLTGDYRIVRGGSFIQKAAQCRSASRGSHPPTDRISNVGFRWIAAGTTTSTSTKPAPRIPETLSPGKKP